MPTGIISLVHKRCNDVIFLEMNNDCHAGICKTPVNKGISRMDILQMKNLVSISVCVV